MPKNGDKAYSRALIYLAHRINPHKKWYFFASALALATVGTSLMNVTATQRLVDGASPGDAGKITQNVLLLAALILVNYVIARTSGVSVARFSSGASRDMKRAVADALIHADYREIAKLRAGDALSTINADTKEASDFLGGSLISLFSQAAMAVGAIVYLLCTDPALMVVTFAYTPVGMFFTLTLNARMNRLYPVRAERTGDALSVMEQALTQIPVIKSFMLEAQTRRRVQASCNAVLDTELRIARSDAPLQTACQSTSSIPRILFLLYAGTLVLRGDMTLGAFVAVFDLLNYIIGPSVYFPFLMNGLNRAVASVNRVKRLEELPRAVENAPHPGAPSVVLERVSFAYAPGAPVLLGLTFEHRGPGLVAIKGQSGRGKTTLLDLLAGLMQPDSGTLRVGGAIAVMEQEPYLFEWNTERENANATLSGGQKQRAAFSRMSCSDANVWLLDEPTASLDAASESDLITVLERERERRLIVVSSHKRAIWDVADVVLDLDAEGGDAL